MTATVSPLLGMLLVGLGGGIGAAARFWLADSIKARRPTGFPWGTWIVNVLGSLLIGAVTGWLVLAGPGGEPWRLLLATGLCGGFTTFSTATVETVTMFRGGRHVAAVLHALSTLAVTVLAVVGGIALVGAAVGGS
ncbi:fluoride efflux transporter CrcB [Isoptericola sp. S6320L]|uniref:fluoride efflux transporter CrcB n=1 Tax=Isoptericola sp. S6320L TaxID=2926411 RepID=UPI001FF45AC7|nr:fluoride efflux transporter CrcB [Isoptericola sp. S6320L]MCK0117307.1 fluoride efflux transporter CrcB [Isoptericola sp. S6320L]